MKIKKSIVILLLFIVLIFGLLYVEAGIRTNNEDLPNPMQSNLSDQQSNTTIPGSEAPAKQKSVQKSSTTKEQGTKLCLTCGGTGTIQKQEIVHELVTCTFCDGEGHLIDPDSHEYMICPYCSGSGQIEGEKIKTVTVTCPTCGGSGKVSA